MQKTAFVCTVGVLYTVTTICRQLSSTDSNLFSRIYNYKPPVLFAYLCLYQRKLNYHDIVDVICKYEIIC